MKGGLALLLAAPKPKASPKAEGASVKSRALKAVISAMKDEDDAAAAEALGLAIQACMDDYEARETETEEDEG
jgi:hypothetical protein